MNWRLVLLIALILAVVIVAPITMGKGAEHKTSLEGVWEAVRIGPTVEGPLEIFRSNETWNAEIAQFEVPVAHKDGRLTLELPRGQGWFDGRLEKDGSAIRGHWTQRQVVNVGARFSSPVILNRAGKDRWRGQVVPLKDEMTLYLVISRRPDGTLGALLRNPDRNVGYLWRVDRLEQDGNQLTLIRNPQAAGSAAFPQDEVADSVVAQGVYRPESNRISFYFGQIGGSYDFAPITNSSDFYALGRETEPYRYRPPVAEDDGWAVGTLEEVGMTAESIGELVRFVSAPFTSIEDLYLHGILVARHGKLVLEEYFYGHHRNKPHDTRSASKSLTATLVGAAIFNGAKLDPSTKVYDLLYKGSLPVDLDPRKKEMTVEHLLNMASGFDCDDRANPPRPGNEDRIWALNTDTYKVTLNLPMDGKPGSRIAYCSIDPNLLGAVLSAATGKSLADLFQDLIAEPLQIKRYYLNLQPTGEPYMGGGIRWLPRDFLKLGQLMLNEGVWNGKRVVTKEWARRASTPMVKIKTRGNTACVPGSTPTLCLRNYGYLWWHFDFPYKGKTVHGYYAGGNGGQAVTVIPELDMVVETWGGNYASLAGLKIQEELIPRFILPAIEDESR